MIFDDMTQEFTFENTKCQRSPKQSMFYGNSGKNRAQKNEREKKN